MDPSLLGCLFQLGLRRFQPPIFRCYVSFRGCYWKDHVPFVSGCLALRFRHVCTPPTKRNITPENMPFFPKKRSIFFLTISQVLGYTRSLTIRFSFLGPGHFLRTRSLVGFTESPSLLNIQEVLTIIVPEESPNTASFPGAGLPLGDCIMYQLENKTIVGGWTNPFEKYCSNCIISPGFGMNTKNIYETTT